MEVEFVRCLNCQTKTEATEIVYDDYDQPFCSGECYAEYMQGQFEDAQDIALDRYIQESQA